MLSLHVVYVCALSYTNLCLMYQRHPHIRPVNCKRYINYVATPLNIVETTLYELHPIPQPLAFIHIDNNDVICWHICVYRSYFPYLNNFWKTTAFNYNIVGFSSMIYFIVSDMKYVRDYSSIIQSKLVTIERLLSLSYLVWSVKQTHSSHKTVCL